MSDALSVFFLALVQGFTEFLPISSSAHLIALPSLFGWSDQGLAEDVATHFGTLGAVLIYFRTRIFTLTMASIQFLRTREPSEDSRYTLYLVLATIPIVIVGWATKDFVESELRSVVLIASTTLFFGLLLFLADRVGKQKKHEVEMNVWNALFIGLGQVLALIPGTSRSGITITCALFLGFTRVAAARFSFLLAIPAIGGASVLILADLLGEPLSVDWMRIVVASLVSFVTAYLCIEFFMKLVERIGMTPFVVYRVLLAVGLLIWVWMF